jgi:hypothetical protein
MNAPVENDTATRRKLFYQRLFWFDFFGGRPITRLSWQLSTQLNSHSYSYNHNHRHHPSTCIENPTKTQPFPHRKRGG